MTVFELVLYTAISIQCGEPFIINETQNPVSKYDLEVLEDAKVRCGQLYEDAPCVKKFYIKGNQNYWVICGN